MNLAFYADPIDRLHQENLQFLKAQRWLPNSFGSFGQDVEQWTARLLRGMGYGVELTSYHHSFDLLLNGCLRVEVKGSRLAYLAERRSYRYQANIRNRGAEVVLLVCEDVFCLRHVFVMPAAIVRPGNLTIWNRDPQAYRGQWAPYLGAWGWLEESLRQAQGAIQLGLPDVG